MGKTGAGRAARMAVAVLGVIALLAAAGGASAQSKSYSSGSSRSSSSSTWQNKSTQPRSSGTLWDRSTPSSSTSPSSGGYTKPAANSNVPSAANSNQPGVPAGVTSSGGYAKPGAAAPIKSLNSTESRAPASTAPAGGITSSGGYTKPSGAGPAAASPSPPGGGSGAGSGGPTKPPASAFDRGAERQLSSQSLARYKAEQDRFKQPASGTMTGASNYSGNPLYNANAGRYNNYNQAYADRDRYFSGHGWSPPSYAFRSAPSFGMWDALFWWMVLDKITEPSHAAAAYNNSNDPGFQAWRREADRMAADNAELKAKLNAMDAKLSTMQGQPQKPGTLPDGVPAAVALAPAVAVAPAGTATLVMGTGGTAGNYYPFCQGGEAIRGLRGWLKDFKVECRATNGSVENMDGLAEGNFDAILVQSDVYNEWLGHHPGVRLDALQATIYQEYVQMLANKDAKIGSVGDLDPQRHVLYLVGSGAQRTWESFVTLVPRLGEFERAGHLRRVPSDPGVLEAVAANQNAVMVYVSGLKSDLLKLANDRFGDKLAMIPVDEGKLDDAVDRTGHKIYAFAKIPTGIYPKLQKSYWFGLSSAVTSLTVGAVFILSERWVTEHGIASLGKVEEALWHTIPEIERKVGVGG
ncbi:MAG: TAXI family TRAP transporter solute-binding subunit [Rhodospirillaceae bacterium]